MRIRETCEYESDIQSKAAAHPQPKPTTAPSHANVRKPKASTQSTQEIWSNWTAQGSDAVMTDRGEYGGNGSEMGDQSGQPPSNGDSSPTSSSSLHGGDSSVQSSARASTQTFPSSNGEPLSVHPSQVTNYQSENNLRWNTPVTEGLGQIGQLSSPPALSKNAQHIAQHMAQDVSRKRPRSSNYPEQVGGSFDTARAGPETLADGDGNAWAFVERSAFDNDRASTRVTGHMSVRNGGQTRYVGPSFWALLKGHEELCERSLGERSDLPENVPQPHIDSLGLANLLTTLPPKPLCDLLLESFSVSVYPIHPMIHWATFQNDYNNFWQWCRNSDIAQPDNKLLGDPTFLCLLFSTMYCGALTAPPMLWSSEQFKDNPKESLLVQLGRTYSSSLDLCQAPDYPTLYTLVASLFVHSCSRPDASAMADLRFVGSSLRIAQVMGLHRDGAAFGLGRIECEMRRRVWWHIIWLDVQASLLHGYSSCCGYSEAQQVAMVTDVRDEQLSSMSVTLTPRSSPPAQSMTSITMLCSIGRYEVSKFKHYLIHILDSPKQEDTLYDKVVKSARSLQEKLDKLITRIPAQGIPETGFVPSRYHNASPSTHQWLYRDHPSSPTIWSSWVKIVLGMLKTDIAISVQKPFLDRADQGSDQQQRVWNSVIQSCVAYLRSFMQITQIPAFAPYLWYCLNHQAPLQYVFLILTYLQHNRHSEHAHLARYYVDEVIDVFASLELPARARGNNQGLEATEGNLQLKPKPCAWRMLIDLQHKLDLPSTVSSPLFKPTAPIRCQPVPSTIALRTMSLSTGEKPGEDVSREALRGPGNGEAAPMPTTEPLLPPPRPLILNDQYGNRGNYTDIDQLLDLSQLDTWPSSLAPKGTEDYSLMQEDFAGFDNNVHMQDSMGHAPLNFA